MMSMELFFLQIQGSGRVRLPTARRCASITPTGTGHPYRSVGRVLIDRGELKAEQASMQGIQAWARADPAKLDELLNSNPSYVFFRETKSAGGDELGPPGALGVPLTAGRSIAVDPAQVPLGAPVFLATTRPNTTEPLQRLMLAQDTGGPSVAWCVPTFSGASVPKPVQRPGACASRGRCGLSCRWVSRWKKRRNVEFSVISFSMMATNFWRRRLRRRPRILKH